MSLVSFMRLSACVYAVQYNCSRHRPLKYLGSGTVWRRTNRSPQLQQTAADDEGRWIPLFWLIFLSFFIAVPAVITASLRPTAKWGAAEQFHCKPVSETPFHLCDQPSNVWRGLWCTHFSDVFQKPRKTVRLQTQISLSISLSHHQYRWQIKLMSAD